MFCCVHLKAHQALDDSEAEDGIDDADDSDEPEDDVAAEAEAFDGDINMNLDVVDDDGGGKKARGGGGKVAAAAPKIPANPSNMAFDLPRGICIHDCERVKHRSGHFVCWTTSAGVQTVIGKMTVWGPGLQNVAMHCKLKGHEGCKRAGKTVDHQAEDMERWLFKGVNCTGAEHMGMAL